MMTANCHFSAWVETTTQLQSRPGLQSETLPHKKTQRGGGHNWEVMQRKQQWNKGSRRNLKTLVRASE